MRKTTGNPIVPSIPIAVLIDHGTVSNGELTAAALKEYGGAILVGQQTAGALEFSTVDPIRLPDGAGIRVAFARVRSGKGIEIEGRGDPADIVVQQDPEMTQDIQLDRAIQVLRQRLSLRRSRAA
jgi:carboxyl-terminal processing protease